MKANHAAIPILLCACLWNATPVMANTAAKTAVASTSISAELKELPSNAVRIVEAAIEFFEMGDAKVRTSHDSKRELRVTVERPTGSDGTKFPNTLTLIIGVEDGKLRKLDANGIPDKNKQTAGKSDAVEETRDFALRLLGKNVSVGITPQMVYGGMEVPIYPLVNEIPIQETIATVYFDASGNFRNFRLKDAKVNKNNLPSATDLLTEKNAKQLFGDQLKMKLVYDDENGIYQYVADPLAWIDAKTGQASALPYQIAEEAYTITSPAREGNLSAGQAKQLAVDFLGLNKEKLTLKSSRQSQPGTEPIVLHTMEDSGRQVVVAVEESSGSLLSITNNIIGNVQDSPLTTRAEAKNMALEFIENHLTLPTGTYTLQERFPAGEESGWALNNHLPAEYELSIFAVVKGVMAAKPLTVVTVDLHGNIITAVNTRTASSNNPAPSSLISEDQAKQALLDNLDIELNYVLDGKNGRSTLVYVPSYDLDGRYVDAATGKLGWKKGW